MVNLYQVLDPKLEFENKQGFMDFFVIIPILTLVINQNKTGSASL